ncbi:MAG TPA: hypothetical protein VNQ79_03010 [Blastocatellia bacterium]|nr:hypothetical protein [Blastocatellia bacterium]
MRIVLLSLLLAVLLPATGLSQGKTDAKAQEILKQARKAIGSEDKLKALQSLSATGTRRFSMGGNTMENELEVEMIVPEKIRTSNISQRGTNVQVLNGDQIWSEFIPSVDAGPGGGMFRGGGPGGGSPQEREAQENRQKAEILRLTLGWLLVAPSAFPLEYTYAGEATAPDGKADVIDVKGPHEFAARLFFDQKSHQLLMLSYKGRDFRQMMRMRGPGQGGPGQGRPPGFLTREQLEKLPPEERAKKEAEQRAQREKMQAEMREMMAKLPEVEFQWSFGEYKSVSGLNLPHRLIKATAGETTEEWEISRFKVNPQIKPDKFEKKEKSQG